MYVSPPRLYNIRTRKLLNVALCERTILVETTRDDFARGISPRELCPGEPRERAGDTPKPI